MLAYFKAPVFLENDSWRIRSLQTWDAAGKRCEDYFFDSGGNISEVRSPGGCFSALYLDNRPHYWERQPPGGPEGEERAGEAGLALQWDEQGFLVSLRFGKTTFGKTAFGPIAAVTASPAEYRYEYERDAAGNWTKRQDIAVINRFGVFAPRPDRVWTRQISLVED